MTVDAVVFAGGLGFVSSPLALFHERRGAGGVKRVIIIANIYKRVPAFKNFLAVFIISD